MNRRLAVAGLSLATIALAAAPAVAVQTDRGDQLKQVDSVTGPKVAKIGQPAPDFTLMSAEGKKINLKEYRGKTVVLEWFNPECPYVVRQHEKGELKDCGNKAVEDGIIWLAINSGAPGMQGHGADKNLTIADRWKLNYPVLIDEKGVVGRLYQAKNTPQMFVIDRKGRLVYSGAIDNDPRGQLVLAERVNYVTAALADLKKGRADEKPVIRTPKTKPYGCSVKYAKP